MVPSAQTHPDTSPQLRDYFQGVSKLAARICRPLKPIQTHLFSFEIIFNYASKLATRLCRPHNSFKHISPTPTSLSRCLKALYQASSAANLAKLRPLGAKTPDLQALIPDFVSYDRKSLDLPGQCSSRFLHRKEGGSEDDDEETLAEATAEVALRSYPQQYPQNPHILPVPQGTRETHTIFVELSSRAVALSAYVQNTSHRTCLLSNSDSIPKQRHDFAQSKALELFL